MAKKVGIASVVIFIVWNVIDFLVHGMMLQSIYATQPEIWRSMEEMKMGVMYFVVFASAVCFTLVYVMFISPKNMNTAMKYGLIFGIGAGITFGYGTYAVQPIPYTLALSWFSVTLVEAFIGGILLGVLVKE